MIQIITLENILVEVARVCNVSLEEIKGSNRNPRLANARTIYCRIASLVGYTYKDIGEAINKSRNVPYYANKNRKRIFLLQQSELIIKTNLGVLL